MGIIELYLDNDTWMTDNSKASNADEIMDLFGQHDLPTPYTSQTKASVVVARLCELNPGAIVTLRD